jgi:uncharacterized protein (DUF302 family)
LAIRRVDGGAPHTSAACRALAARLLDGSTFGGSIAIDLAAAAPVLRSRPGEIVAVIAISSESGDATTIESRYGPAETAERLATEIRSRGSILFATIDHAAGAADASLPLRPTILLMFGNAVVGTPLMQIDQRIGADLPLKALGSQDADGRTWISCTDPVWLARRYDLPDGTDASHALADKFAPGLRASFMPFPEGPELIVSNPGIRRPRQRHRRPS